MTDERVEILGDLTTSADTLVFNRVPAWLVMALVTGKVYFDDGEFQVPNGAVIEGGWIIMPRKDGDMPLIGFTGDTLLFDGTDITMESRGVVH